MFADTSGQITTIEGLKLNYAGVIKEHPDLKDNDDWRKEATKRLKKHMKNLTSEKAKMEYIKDELTKHGYDAMYYQRAGHRPTKFKGEKK